MQTISDWIVTGLTVSIFIFLLLVFVYILLLRKERDYSQHKNSILNDDTDDNTQHIE